MTMREKVSNVTVSPGIMQVGWTILEILVAAALAMMGIILLTKCISAIVDSFSKRRQKQLSRNKRDDEDVREKIRMEERSKLSIHEPRVELATKLGHEKREAV